MSSVEADLTPRSLDEQQECGLFTGRQSGPCPEPMAPNADRCVTCLGEQVVRLMQTCQELSESRSPAGPSYLYLPARGGEVEAWVKRWRDRYVQEGDTYRDKFGWDAINEMLDDLRDRSDIGASWSDVLDQSAPVPTVIPADDGHTPARDLGLCNGVDSCEHGRAWNAACERCTSGRLSELVALWGRDTAAAASCRRSVRMVWPELAERLDDLLDQQDGGGER